MSQFEVLDCTLRDGGYYTNWDFDADLVQDYCETMALLPVSTVEIGYRSNPQTEYFGEFFFLSAAKLAYVKTLLRPDQKLAVMLNYKDVSLDNVADVLRGGAEYIDIVRFACPPNQLPECIELARVVSSLGIEVAINVMYLTKYINDVSVLAPLASARDCVQYVSLVDSYGGCFPADVGRAIAATRALLPQPIGFHGHDNVSMAFACAIAAIEAGASIVDATVLGMGRGAGNLKTELILAYRDQQQPGEMSYARLSSLLARFQALQLEFGWGTNFAYMISGLADLPQADVMDWLGTRRYSLDSIVTALRHQGGVELDKLDVPALAGSDFAEPLSGSPVVIVGGGGSVAVHGDAIKTLIQHLGATIVHSTARMAHVFSDLKAVQVFCLPGQELERISQAQQSALFGGDACVVVPAGPRFANSVPCKARIFEVSNLPVLGDAPKQLGPVTDEPPLGLALAAARALSASAVYLAGFDGYADASLADQKNALDVQHAIDTAKEHWPNWPVVSLTPSLYRVAQKSVHELVQGVAKPVAAFKIGGKAA